MLQLVPPSHIDAAWRSGAHLLSEAAARTDECTADQLKMRLGRGELDLLHDDGAWAAVQILQYPNYRCLWVYSIYARHKANIKALEGLEAYAKANGCSRIQGACCESVARLWSRLGFKRAYEVMEYEVSE